MRGCTGLVLFLAATAWGAAPPAQPRDLTEQEKKEVAALQARGARHASVGEFEQAAKVSQQIVDYRRDRQGARHHQAIDARFVLERWRRLARVPTKDRAEVLRAGRLHEEGLDLLNRGRSREAEKPIRQALRIDEKVLGKEHPDTATTTNNLASCLHGQGKYAEALTLHRQALRIREKALGKEQPATALSYKNLADCLHEQGKYAEALPLYRQVLEICEKVLGKEHPRTAASYTNLALGLTHLGKSEEALPLYR